MYGLCEKCSPGDPLSAGIPMTLAGGYRTKLCDRHANEWHEKIREATICQHYAAVKVLLRCAISNGDNDESVRQMSQRLSAEHRLYDLAKAWCQEPEPVDKPAPRLTVLTYDEPEPAPVVEAQVEPQSSHEELQAYVDAFNDEYKELGLLDAEPEHGDRREGL